MALVVRPISAALAAMELRSLLGSLAFPPIWGPIPSAVEAAVALMLRVVPEALVEALVEALTQALQARMDLVVVAVAVPTGPPGLAGPAEPVAWRFNMPTTAMWQLET